MKKVGNLFDTLAMILVLTSACQGGEQKAGRVAPRDYRSTACWLNRRGDLEAFLVLAREDRNAVPYLVSARCSESDRNHSYAQATILRLNTIRVIDRFGRLQSHFPTLQILDNVATDRPSPSPGDPVYYFRAHLVRLPSRYQPIYAVGEIIELSNLNVSFASFLDMPKQQRDRLYASFAPHP